jgi:HEAT repeat protein
VAAAKVSVSILIDALREASEKPREVAEESLGRVGKPAVRPLIAALKGDDARVRSGAAAALGRIGAAAGAAVPALRQALHDPRAPVREQAARALGRIGPQARGVIPLLCELAVNDPDSGVVSRAVGALEALGADPRVAVPAIIAALEGRVTFNGLCALCALGADARAAVSVLCRLLEEPTPDDRNWIHTIAARALGGIGADGAPGVSLLLREVQHKSPTNRSIALEALGEIGLAAHDALQDIIDALDDPVWEVRWAAFGALSRLTWWNRLRLPAQQAAWRVLTEAVRETHCRATLEPAVDLLLRFDPSRKTVTELLRTVFEKGNARDPRGVRSQMVRLGLLPAEPRKPPEETSLRTLLELLGSNSDIVQRDAIDALARIGPPARPAVPQLVALLRGEAKGLHGNAAHALLAIGAETRLALGVMGGSIWDDRACHSYAQHTYARRDREELRDNATALAALKAALADNDEATRLRAALILARLDVHPEPVISTLAAAAAVDPWDGLVRPRLVAAELLGRLGSAARSALPVLRAALGTLHHWELRRTVRAAVARIQEDA